MNFYGNPKGALFLGTLICVMGLVGVQAQPGKEMKSTQLAVCETAAAPYEACVQRNCPEPSDESVKACEKQLACDVSCWKNNWETLPTSTKKQCTNDVVVAGGPLTSTCTPGVEEASPMAAGDVAKDEACLVCRKNKASGVFACSNGKSYSSEESLPEVDGETSAFNCIRVIH